MEQNQAATSGKYRKKPVVIEAFQIPPDDGGPHAAPEWAVIAVATGVVVACPGGGVDIVTLEGTMHGNVGDWIIQGVKGELYPCKPDIFDATYEPAGDEEAPTDPNPPHALMALRLENNGITIEVKNNISTMSEVLHFANWIGLNLDALALLARQDWHLRNEINRLALQQQTQELQRQAEGGEQPAIDTGRPRLVSANGGPLQ